MPDAWVEGRPLAGVDVDDVPCDRRERAEVFKDLFSSCRMRGSTVVRSTPGGSEPTSTARARFTGFCAVAPSRRGE